MCNDKPEGSRQPVSLSRSSGAAGAANQLRGSAMSDDATIIRIPLDAEAHRRGYLAGRRDNPDEVNPFQPGTRKALAWAMGHADGRKKRLRIIRDERS